MLFRSNADADLSTGIIAAQTGTIQAGYVAADMPDATLLEFATPEEAVSAVRNGEADAVLADKAYLVPIAEAEADLDFAGEDVLIGGGIGLGIRQTDTDLKAKFDTAIQSMKDDGSLNTLITDMLPGSAPF